MKGLYIILSLGLMASQLQAQVLYQNGAVLHINTGGAINVNGNVQVQSGSTLTNNGTFRIAGNVVNNHTMTAAGTGLLELNGSAAQSLSGTGVYYAKDVVVDNAAGITLNAPLKADGAVTLTNGIISAINTANPLIITATGTVSGASDASHVNGYIVKEGSGSFTYPVGDGTKYQQVTVNTTANSDGIRVRYHAADAGSGTFTGIVDYNNKEYWDIHPLGTTTGTVTIYWDGYNDSYPNLLTERRVAHKIGTNWVDEGGTATGIIAAGSVTSNAVSTWSPFTLGSSGMPLPITLIDFSAVNQGRMNFLEWYTGTEDAGDIFEIEHSADGRTFSKIGTAEAKGIAGSFYRFIHKAPVTGINYYRLYLVNMDSSNAYSKVVTARVIERDFLLSIYPNPFTDYVKLSITGRISGKAKVTVSDISGKTLLAETVNSNLYTFSLQHLSRGTYFIRYQDEVNTETIKVMK